MRTKASYKGELPRESDEPGRRTALQAVKVSGDLSDPRFSTTALIMAMNGVLRDPSEARRRSREDSRTMRRDPRIEKSLKKRKLATAGLKWDIEPEEEDDEGQIEAAATIKKIIERFDYIELIENMLEALWYGPGPAELIVEFDERDRLYVISGTRALHGDSVVFDAYGQPLLRVMGGHPAAEPGFESPVRKLTPAEQQVFMLHVFNPAAPDFWTPEENALVFHGQGLREDVWYPWWISNHIHKQWVYFLERYAGGIVTIAHADFPEAREAAEEAIRNYKDGGYLLVPMMGDAVDIKAFTFDIQEAPSNSAGMFMDYVDGFTGGLIKQIIEGQILTSEAAATGLGSGVAKAHENTFQMYTEYDARRLGRTLTKQLVWRLQRWNNIMPEKRFSWEFAVDETDIKDKMTAVKQAYDMNVQFVADEVRQLTGLSKPTPEDEVVGGVQMGGPAFGDQMSLFGSMDPAAGQPTGDNGDIQMPSPDTQNRMAGLLN